MRANEFLTELRNRVQDYLQQQFSDWPPYVVNDLLYKNAKGIDSQAELEDWIAGIKKDYKVKRWELINDMPITFKMFHPETKKQLIARGVGGNEIKNPYNVPKDDERHATQAAIIHQQGVASEPIILMKGRNQYYLIEGWHRTIQHLRAYPQGYQGPAWVGYL